MNYSTLKRGLAVSMLSLAGVATVATAQETQTSTSESNAKVFGGRKQYRTWSIGVHAGALMPNAVIGGPNDYTGYKPELGYGINITKQLGHAFALQLNGTRGQVTSNNDRRTASGFQMMNTFVAGNQNVRSNTTSVQYAVDLKGVVNVATVDFLRRKNSVNFLVSAGYGYMAYAPSTTLANGMTVPATNEGTFGSDKDGKYVGGKDYVKGFYVPVGVGVKFRVSNRVNFDLGYTMNFVDDNKFDGARGLDNPKRNDRFSYAYAGLNFSLGSKDKEDLQWVNPLALMYDELKDESLRKEVEALKGRVANVEQAVEGLKKDSDGDGVADQFDKCPGTPAGTAVDGSGCPLPKFEAPAQQNNLANSAEVTGWENVQFDWNSYVLKTESYPTLDKLSGMLRDDSGLKVLLKGYASSEGTPAYNMQLSKDRSNSVKSYLINSGVKATQLSTKGFGTKNPVASNDTEDGRIKNRRVEIARN